MPLAKSYRKPRTAVQRFRNAIWAHPHVETYVRHPSALLDDMRFQPARLEVIGMVFDITEEIWPCTAKVTGRFFQP